MRGAYRIWLKKVVIIFVSALRTAVSRALASHSHWARAGWEQMAQSGSRFIVVAPYVGLVNIRICLKQST